MEAVKSLEKTLADLYKSAPHLPVNARKWLGENVWWLALIGVVLSVFSLFVVVPLALAAIGLSTLAVGTSYGMYASGSSLGMAWLTVMVGLVSLIATTVLLATAITPLKAKAKKGWTLLFLSLLVSLLLTIVNDFLVLDLFAAVFAVLWAAIGAYFLFEIRGEFGKAAKPAAVHKK